MRRKTVIVNGNLVVVWCWTHDTSEQAPKKVEEFTPNARRVRLTLEQDVAGSDVWILEGREADSKVHLTRYYSDGREYLYDSIPDDLGEAFNPPAGMSANVWAYAVSEAHERVCQGRQGGCNCEADRRRLTKSGLLG